MGITLLDRAEPQHTQPLHTVKTWRGEYLEI